MPNAPNATVQTALTNKKITRKNTLQVRENSLVWIFSTLLYCDYLCDDQNLIDFFYLWLSVCLRFNFAWSVQIKLQII